MVCRWAGLWSSKAEVMVNHMDNRQFQAELQVSLKVQLSCANATCVFNFKN